MMCVDSRELCKHSMRTGALVICSSLEDIYVANERKKVDHGGRRKKGRRYCRFGNSIGMGLLWHICVTNCDHFVFKASDPTRSPGRN